MAEGITVREEGVLSTGWMDNHPGLAVRARTAFAIKHEKFTVDASLKGFITLKWEMEGD